MTLIPLFEKVKVVPVTAVSDEEAPESVVSADVSVDVSEESELDPTPESELGTSVSLEFPPPEHPVEIAGVSAIRAARVRINKRFCFMVGYSFLL